jgi:hypothetical protein
MDSMKALLGKNFPDLRRYHMKVAPVATITSSAPGLLGIIGLTTTTTVALPVAGIVAGAGLATYGVVKVLKWLNE